MCFLLPLADSDEFIFLARRVGYTTAGKAGARHLQIDIEEHMTATRKFFEDVWEGVMENGKEE